MKKECKLSVMKTMFVLSLILLAGTPLSAQIGIVVRPDSLDNSWRNTWKGCHVGPVDVITPNSKRKIRPHWEGMYFGFTKFLDKEWKDYKGDIELDWANSFTLQFNMKELGIAASGTGNSLLYTGFGLDYHRLYFDRDITLRKQADGSIAPVSLASIGVVDPRRSVFKALYLTVPLLFEVQYAKHKGFLSAGLVGGVRLHSKTKIVHDDGGKRKLKRSGSYGMYPFKVEATVRVGYGPISIWASKSLMPMFNPNKSPRVYPFTIGFGFKGALGTHSSFSIST
jgi:hypothetical protein